MSPFFLKVPSPTEIYTLSLHDALPICPVFLMNVTSVEEARAILEKLPLGRAKLMEFEYVELSPLTRSESTRLNSSHMSISYAVFCLKKKIHRIHHGDRGLHFRPVQISL